MVNFIVENDWNMGFLKIDWFFPLKIDCFVSHYIPTFKIHMRFSKFIFFLYNLPLGRGVDTYLITYTLDPRLLWFLIAWLFWAVSKKILITWFNHIIESLFVSKLRSSNSCQILIDFWVIVPANLGKCCKLNPTFHSVIKIILKEFFSSFA